MLEQLTHIMKSNWDDFGQGLERPTRLSYMGISGSLEGGSATFLAFADHQARPIFAAKVHRRDVTATRVKCERELLDRVRILGGIVGSSVPRILYAGKVDGMAVLVQTICEGTPMSVSLQKNGQPKLREAERNLHSALTWLLEMVKGSGTRVPSGSSRLNVVDDLLSEDRGNLEMPTRRYLEDVRAKPAEEVDTFQCIQHGDFCRHNLLVSGRQRRVSAIDWSDSRGNGSPAHDAFNFVTTYFLQARRSSGLRGMLECLHQTYFRQSGYSDLVQEQLRWFLDRVGIPITQAQREFALYLVERTILGSRLGVAAEAAGDFSRFSLHRATSLSLDYDRAIRYQYWLDFLQMFCANRDAFRLQS